MIADIVLHFSGGERRKFMARVLPRQHSRAASGRSRLLIPLNPGIRLQGRITPVIQGMDALRPFQGHVPLRLMFKFEQVIFYGEDRAMSRLERGLRTYFLSSG
jgi:hypothetical protein